MVNGKAYSFVFVESKEELPTEWQITDGTSVSIIDTNEGTTHAANNSDIALLNGLQGVVNNLSVERAKSQKELMDFMRADGRKSDDAVISQRTLVDDIANTKKLILAEENNIRDLRATTVRIKKGNSTDKRKRVKAINCKIKSVKLMVATLELTYDQQCVRLQQPNGANGHESDFCVNSESDSCELESGSYSD